jgi:nicotinate-nucleotide pyrophosphorylase (carboxylating)
MQGLALAIEHNVSAALEEDVGSGDLTAGLVDPGTRAGASIITRGDAIICGAPWVDACFRHLDAGVRIEWQVTEGSAATAGQTLCILHGSARSLLTGERTALNFLQLLSGVATNTRC